MRLINDNDVIIFQETFLRVGEERTLTLPPGFEIIAMSRPDIPGLRSAWGGVAAVIRTTIPFKLMSHLCAPDLIVLDLHHLFLVGSYLLPAASGWRDWTTVDPQIKLAEAVTALSIHVEKPLMVGGDINARVGERIPTGAVLARSSSDPVVNTRGRWLLRLCSDTAMTILNGTTKESSNRGAFTSFQPLGSSVIDYCFVSAGLIPRIGEGSLRVVKSPVWSDHAQVQIAVIKPEARLDLSTPTRVPRPSPILFKEPGPLDLLLKATLEACVSSEEATARLYGPVYTTSGFVSVYIGSSCRSGTAAFSLWWGTGSTRNCAYVLENGGSEGLASILGVLCAVRDCPPDKSLAIYMSSQYVIRSFCYWAGDNETRGWSCANGDELCDAVEWIAQRRAPVEFRWVASNSGSQSLLAAKRSARLALAVALPNFFHYLPAPTFVAARDAEVMDIPKVTTRLREFPDSKERELPEIDVEQIIDTDVGHRGRRRYCPT